MTHLAIVNFVIYALINAFTPGPGNILALNTVNAYGYRRGRPLFYGIYSGYYAVQALCSLFVFGLSSIIPSFLGVMKYIGAAYIVYLAIHIALSKPSEDDNEVSASFWRGFLLQFVNVKIYLFGITALTGYITDFSTQLWVLLAVGLIIATIGSIATMTWVGLGILIQQLYTRHFRIINIILALTLMECVYSILTM